MPEIRENNGQIQLNMGFLGGLNEMTQRINSSGFEMNFMVSKVMYEP